MAKIAQVMPATLRKNIKLLQKMLEKAND